MTVGQGNDSCCMSTPPYRIIVSSYFCFVCLSSTQPNVPCSTVSYIFCAKATHSLFFISHAQSGPSQYSSAQVVTVMYGTNPAGGAISYACRSGVCGKKGGAASWDLRGSGVIRATGGGLRDARSGAICITVITRGTKARSLTETDAWEKWCQQT